MSSYSLRDLVNYLLYYIGNPIIIILTGIAVVIFFWGIIRFIWSAGDERSFRRGRELMLWGILAMFAITALWGIVAFLQSSFGLN